MVDTYKKSPGTDFSSWARAYLAMLATGSEHQVTRACRRTGPGILDGSSYNSTAESQSAKTSQTDANMEGSAAIKRTAS
jgi:hypothetical protein